MKEYLGYFGAWFMLITIILVTYWDWFRKISPMESIIWSSAIFIGFVGLILWFKFRKK